MKQNSFNEKRDVHTMTPSTEIFFEMDVKKSLPTTVHSVNGP